MLKQVGYFEIYSLVLHLHASQNFKVFMIDFKKIGLKCPSCGDSPMRVEKNRVLGSFNSYKNFCTKCGCEVEINKKPGIYAEILFHFALFVLLSVFFSF